MTHPASDNPPAPDWLDRLIRSKAEIASGQTTDMLLVLDRLRARAEQLEAEMGVPPDNDPAPGR